MSIAGPDFFRRMGALLLLLVSLGVPIPSGAAGGDLPPGAPPPSPGMARIWVYREYEPYQSLSTPYVRFNGAIVGVSEAVGAFYRDVPPGRYTVTVDCDGRDVNQFATLAVAAGQQAFIKIVSLRGWDTSGGAKHDAERDTFYTWEIPPQAAAAEIAQMPLYNGG
jgi:hypothetical protein